MTERNSLGEATRRLPRNAAIAFGFALTLLAGAFTIVAALSAANADAWADHSARVRQTAITLFSTVQDAEMGQRGYLLTGDAGYLILFRDAERRMPVIEGALRNLVSDNAAQEAVLAQWTSAIDARLTSLRNNIALAQSGNMAAAIAAMKTNAGRDRMQQVRSFSAEFDQAELKLQASREASAQTQRTILAVLILFSILAAGGVAVVVGLASRRHSAELREHNRALAHEIAGRERAESQLRQSQKMESLGQLTGGIAHDFNNMLAIIVSNLDILMRRLSAEDGRLRTLTEAALTGAQRAVRLTQRLLAFSRLQPLDPKATDVNKCVAEMSEILHRALGEHISVETVLGSGLWRAHIDRPQLESAILNLALNARDAMPEGGKLTIETSNAYLGQDYADAHGEVQAGQYVLLAITDSGSGIPPGVLEKVFEPFFTTKRMGEGTGLGLSQVHGFIKQSRGHVQMYSEVGVGTTAKLYLPREIAQSDTGAIAPRPALPPLAQKFTILIVEDDDAVRTFAASAARELGYAVVDAPGGAQALDMLRARADISLLLTDVVMPGMNGRMLADAALEIRPALRVLYMTGYTRNAIVHNGVLDAGTRLLTKPFTLDELDRELRGLLTA
jgi:signal transduction histidine kinase